MTNYDKIFLSGSFKTEFWHDIENDPFNRDVSEQDVRITIGYQFPIGDTMGLSLELFVARFKDVMRTEGEGTNPSLFNDLLGGILSYGISLSEFCSIGLNASFYSNTRTQDVDTTNPSFQQYEFEQKITSFAYTIGFLIKNQDSTIIFDTLVGWSHGKYAVIKDPEVNISTIPSPEFSDVFKEVYLPIYNENTISFALMNKKAFIVGKWINNIYVDRSYYVTRLIPAGEIWLAKWFSLRAGVEGSFVKMEDETVFGIGGTGGFSLRFGKIDCDFNLTYRKKPSRVFPGQEINEFTLFFTLSLNDLWVSR